MSEQQVITKVTGGGWLAIAELLGAVPSIEEILRRCECWSLLLGLPGREQVN